MYNLLCQVTCLCILFIMLGDVQFIMSGNLFMYFVYNVGDVLFIMSGNLFMYFVYNVG